MGKIHSLETMGLVDGPGIRVVVFFQGCDLRCIYCHNPDTWALNGGQQIEAKELLRKVVKFKPYWARSGGGVTCSGGEPLLQPQFLIEFLKLCKENGIHTALDTAGFGRGYYREILQYTDLVILDLKHVDDRGYQELTGRNMAEFKKFIQAVQEFSVKLWIRHVVIPGLTDSREHLRQLEKKISSFKNVEKVELLPYHTLGVHKYKEMGIKYRL